MTASMPTKLYDIIYADPPWRYEHPPMGDTNRSIENHYPTLSIKELQEINIPAETNAAMFMWATAPMLSKACALMAYWGFSYRTCLCWDKMIIGMGSWARNQHELLLIGIKGKFKAPSVEFRNSSMYHKKRTEHSVKPAFFRTWISEAYPDKSKLEMFARERIEGWDATGNEVPPHTQLQLHEVTS